MFEKFEERDKKYFTSERGRSEKTPWEILFNPPPLASTSRLILSFSQSHLWGNPFRTPDVGHGSIWRMRIRKWNTKWHFSTQQSICMKKNRAPLLMRLFPMLLWHTSPSTGSRLFRTSPKNASSNYQQQTIWPAVAIINSEISNHQKCIQECFELSLLTHGP